MCCIYDSSFQKGVWVQCLPISAFIKMQTLCVTHLNDTVLPSVVTSWLQRIGNMSFMLAFWELAQSCNYAISFCFLKIPRGNQGNGGNIISSVFPQSFQAQDSFYFISNYLLLSDKYLFIQSIKAKRFASSFVIICNLASPIQMYHTNARPMSVLFYH